MESRGAASRERTGCAHTETELRRRRTMNGSSFNYQCLECLRAVGHSVRLSKIEHPARVPRWDYRRSWNTTGRKNSKRLQYEAYLNSAAWKKIKKAAMERAGYRCEAPGCLGDLNLDGHHLRYPEILGTEPVSDVQILCEDHHAAATEGRFA